MTIFTDKIYRGFEANLFQIFGMSTGNFCEVARVGVEDLKSGFDNIFDKHGHDLDYEFRDSWEANRLDGLRGKMNSCLYLL